MQFLKPDYESLKIFFKVNIITKHDLLFLKDISAREYQNNSMASNATTDEQNKLKEIKRKLKSIADKYKEKYDNLYGPFESSVSSGNPIAIGQKKLNRIWSSISKGAENKQYSAQISFVLSTEKLCLDVGFYFGRASAHMLDKETKNRFENQLKELGFILATEIKNDIKLNTIFNSLFDYGFQASIYSAKVTPNFWLNSVQDSPQNSQIIYSIYPDENGIIEPSTVDLYVSMIVYLMNPIPTIAEKKETYKKKKYKPLTPQQRAKQAERKTLIGEEGEIFVMKYESKRLAVLGIFSDKYPDHKAVESTDYGYDILSCDENKNEIFIEVKTTTRLKQDPEATKFHISSGEFSFYKDNKVKFRLYRVYDIEGDPELEVINMDHAQIIADTYLVYAK